MQYLWRCTLLLLFCWGGQWGWTQQNPNGPIPGEMIIQFHPNASIPQLVNDQQTFNGQSTGLTVQRTLSTRLNIYLLEFRSQNVNASRFLEDIRAQQAVKVAQFNHDVQLRPNNTLNTPNDSLFPYQWALHNMGQTGGISDADIDAPEAWYESTKGTTERGDTIVVAVIDGGFDLDHEDIRYWRNWEEVPDNGVDDDNNGYVDDFYGWDAYNGDSSLPEGDHGTHVSGVIGGHGNNWQGIVGVNWNIQVMPVAGASGDESTVVAAYAYALEQRARYYETNGDSGAYVVATNSSFGINYADPDNYPIWRAMYDSMGQYGILSVGATMNKDENVDQVGDMPTACRSDYLMSVTNTTDRDQKHSQAAYGDTTIDLGAPGTGIFSTLGNGDYGRATGTSMATPHVSGAIAFLYANACTDLFQHFSRAPDSLARVMKQIIIENTDALSSLQGRTVSGGRLNLYKSLTALLQPEAHFQLSKDGLTYYFEDSSRYVEEYLWKFGDGEGSSRQDPRHTFPDTAKYDVCLVVSNYGCRKDTVCRTVDVECSTPQAAFGARDSAGSYQVAFTDSSVSGINYLWKFGDGTQSTEANPDHIYPDTGTYLVTQIISSVCGTDTVTKSVKVTCEGAAADYVSRTDELTVDFYASSDEEATYYWNFGDGTEGYGQDINHTYQQEGRYKACLYTINACHRDTFCQYVVASTTGIKSSSNRKNLQVRIYPNPNKGHFQLLLTPQQTLHRAQLRIHNYLGETIYRESIGSLTSQRTFTFRFPEAAPGLYFMTIQTTEHPPLTKRFMIR